MKKSNICLLIILIFSGFVFWKGWTSLRVKPEKFGIVISKTSGINEKPVVNGEFAWNWQFLLPTNAELKLFSIEPVSVTQTITGNLPSGELYTKYLDSSYRFERGTNIDNVPIALNSAVKFTKELAGGQPIRGICDVYPKPEILRQIKVRTKRLNKLVGINLTTAQIETYLLRFKFETKRDGEDVIVSVPPYRHDITQEVDIIHLILYL